jgi:hypothetical protein
MGEPEARRRVPWGLVLAVAVLAGVLYLTLGRQADGSAVLAAVAAAAAAFLAGRWLLNYAWGVVLALAITLHPVFRETSANTGAVAVLPEALQLVSLALVLGGWRLAFLSEFAWPGWLAVGGGLCTDLALAWLTEPCVGLAASLFALVCLAALPFLVAARRRRIGAVRGPSAWNGLAAAAAALLAPTAALLLAPPLGAVMAAQGVTLPAGPDHPGHNPAAAEEFLHAALSGAEPGLPGFSTAELNEWCWPTPWLVLPLAAWGLWRGVRRGGLNWRQGRAPLAWVVPAYALAALAAVALQPASVRTASYLPLATLATFLAVFCAADLLRAGIERMRLAPPHENLGEHTE